MIMQGNIEITNICNFKCKHCYCIGSKQSNSTISRKKFNELVNMLHKTNTLIVYLTGGEPFFLREIDQYYLKLVSEGFLVGVMTNGSLIKDKHIEMLKNTPPYSIEISLYGMSSSTYESVCGVGNGMNYRHIIDVIKELNSQGTNVLVKYVLIKQNLCDLEPFLKFAKLEKLRYEIKPAMFPISKDIDVNKYRISTKTLEHLIDLYPGIFRLPSEVDRIKCEAGSFFCITSDCKVKGCPVMQKKYDLDTDIQESHEKFTSIIDVIKRDVEKSENFYCPAWETLEGREKISRYLSFSNTSL